MWKKNKTTLIAFLLCSVIFMLPFYTVRFTFLAIPFSLPEALLWITAGIWLLQRSRWECVFFVGHKKIFIIISVLVCGAVLSTIFSQDVRAGLGVVKAWFLAPLIFALILLHSRERMPSLGEKLFAAYFYSAVSVAVVALGYFFTHSLTYDGRLQAFYSSPNMLSLYCAPAALYLVLFFAQKKNRIGRGVCMLHILGGVVIAAAVYFTQSYAAWGALIGALMVIAATYQKKTFILTFILGALIIVALFTTQQSTDKVQSLLTNFDRSSLSSRVMIWKSAARMIRDHPFVGIGPNQFQQHYLAYQKYYSPYLEWAVPQPHNLYMAFYLQTGALGFCGFIGLCVYVLQRFFRAQQKTPHALAAGGAFLVILLHGVLDTPYWKTDLAFVFWLIVALLYISTSSAVEER